MGYLIKWTPYTLEENCNDEWYRDLCNPIYEFFEDESEFLYRSRELECFSGEYMPNKYCDGVEVDLYYCSLNTYKKG
jgi:hypothetical protein